VWGRKPKAMGGGSLKTKERIRGFPPPVWLKVEFNGEGEFHQGCSCILLTFSEKKSCGGCTECSSSDHAGGRTGEGVVDFREGCSKKVSQGVDKKV